MFRFYLNQTIKDKFEIIDKEVLNKVSKVLRLKPGDLFRVFNGQKEYEVKIDKIDKKSIFVQVAKEVEKNTDPQIEINLYQALVKKDKLEWIVQKATELGVTKIIPVNSQNCVKDDLSKNKKERLEKIIIEATQQSGGLRLSKIGSLVEFKEAIKNLDTNALNLICHERSKNHHPELDSGSNFLPQEVNIFIGPEGGFSEEEIIFAKEHGLEVISLGKRVLRAETAAVVAIYSLIQKYA